MKEGHGQVNWNLEKSGSVQLMESVGVFFENLVIINKINFVRRKYLLTIFRVYFHLGIYF